MTDDFELRVRDWLREAGTVDPTRVDELAHYAGSLPSRRRPRHTWLRSAAAAVVIVAVAAGAISRLGGWSIGGPAPSPTDNGSLGPKSFAPQPGNPSRFAGDPRMVACGGGDLSNVAYAFEIQHASDYLRYFPASGRSPELEVADPAFAVVFRTLSPFGAGGAPPPPGQTWPPRTARPGYHDVCILVGTDPATWQPNVYPDIDFTGFNPDPPLPGPTA